VRSGSIRVARTEARKSEYDRAAGMARAFGVQIDEISTVEALKMWPPMRTDDMVAVYYQPYDGHTSLVDTARAMAKGAQMGGARISYWTQYTMEQHHIQSRLMYLGVSLYPQHILESIRADSVTISNTVSGVGTDFPCDAVLLVTDRLPNDALYQALKPALNEKKLSSLRLIGDAQAPDIIAQATFSGYLAAAEFDETIPDGTPFKVEYIEA
jgi:hypothetical protein